MICKQCGTRLRDSAHFCFSCGIRLDEQTAPIKPTKNVSPPNINSSEAETVLLEKTNASEAETVLLEKTNASMAETVLLPKTKASEAATVLLPKNSASEISSEAVTVFLTNIPPVAEAELHGDDSNIKVSSKKKNKLVVSVIVIAAILAVSGAILAFLYI